MTRVLVTGFGPFPGAPTNPTERLARHVATVRRVRFGGIDRAFRLLPTAWAALEAFPALVADVKPDAILMFGVAGRRRVVTPEARARNAATPLRADAAGRVPPTRLLTTGAPLVRRGRIDADLMAAALRRAGVPARASRDAGDYLCNALYWRALETGLACIFVHAPRPRRPTAPTRWRKRPRPSAAELDRAGETALAVVLAAVRRRARGALAA